MSICLLIDLAINLLTYRPASVYRLICGPSLSTFRSAYRLTCRSTYVFPMDRPMIDPSIGISADVFNDLSLHHSMVVSTQLLTTYAPIYRSTSLPICRSTYVWYVGLPTDLLSFGLQIYMLIDRSVNISIDLLISLSVDLSNWHIDVLIWLPIGRYLFTYRPVNLWSSLSSCYWPVFQHTDLSVNVSVDLFVDLSIVLSAHQFIHLFICISV